MDASGGSGQTVTGQIRGVAPLLWPLLRPRWPQVLFGVLLVGATRAAGVVVPASTKYLVDDVIGRGRSDLLLPLTVVVVLAVLIQTSTSFFADRVLSKQAVTLVAQLRCKVERHVLRLPAAYFDFQNTGALANCIINDVDAVRHVLGIGVVDFLGGILTALYTLVFLLRINVVLTCTSVGLIAVFSIFSRYRLQRLRPVFHSHFKIRAEVVGRLVESLAGIRVIKSYGAEDQIDRAFARGVRGLMESSHHTIKENSTMGAANMLLIGLVSASVMFIASRQIFAGALTVGGLVTFTAFVTFLMAPVLQFATLSANLIEAFAGLERIQALLQVPSEDHNPRRTERLDIRGHVAFKQVSFAYESGKYAVANITFDSKPGSVTAFVGASGAGKSTIAALIAALYEPAAGIIEVDGVDLTRIRLDSYRSQLGVVPQDTFLFDGTIRENLAFGCPQADGNDILEASRIARVHDFVQKLPQQYETTVGERGVRLSGGQRQRISIARAILANPRILILDEATSSLDSESESAIQEGLAYLLKGRTTFVIAHRLSTIHRADQILVLENGSIVERGTHESLYRAGAHYYRLYTIQHSFQLMPEQSAADLRHSHNVV
jgi:ABC-type multidrug transport system fused ATPase/permease subunit